MFLIMFFSDCFCVFGWLSFFSNRFPLIGSKIKSINQSCKVFLIVLFFFISSYSNLSISSTDTVTGLKNNRSFNFCFSIFCSIKYFSNSKRLFFKNRFFRILFNLFSTGKFKKLDFRDFGDSTNFKHR